MHKGLLANVGTLISIKRPGGRVMIENVGKYCKNERDELRHAQLQYLKYWSLEMKETFWLRLLPMNFMKLVVIMLGNNLICVSRYSN